MPSNQKVAWDDSYKVGIKLIDLQHKKLFELVNRLYDLQEENTKEDLRTILYEFSDYMRTHFNEEEQYMSSIGYPDLQNHKQIHKDIIENLSKLIHTPAKLSIIQSKMRILAKRVLIEHIMHEDTKIKLYQVHNKIEEEIFDISNG